MKRLLMFATMMVLFAPLVFGFSLNWTAVTTYTDNSVIEPANLPVLYDAWMDGAPLAVGTTLLKAPLSDNTYGATHTYKLRARLADGRVSDNAVATLVSPLDSRLPKVPGAPLFIGN